MIGACGSETFLQIVHGSSIYAIQQRFTTFEHVTDCSQILDYVPTVEIIIMIFTELSSKFKHIFCKGLHFDAIITADSFTI